MPCFFSDQYDSGIEYSGYAPRGEYDSVVFRGDVRTGEFIAFWLWDGRVLAGINVNTWGVTDAIETLMRSHPTVDPVRLADTDVPLETMASS